MYIIQIECRRSVAVQSSGVHIFFLRSKQLAYLNRLDKSLSEDKYPVTIMTIMVYEWHKEITF